MKKILLTSLLFAMLTGLNSIQIVYAVNEAASLGYSNEKLSSAEVKEAIGAYKSGDYLACISILKEYVAEEPENAIAWYYLGNSYMNIAMTTEANAAFDKVIEYSTTHKLTSYAIQAQLCMKDSKECKYENFSNAEVDKLKENPVKFIKEYYDAIAKKAIKSDDVIQIENLINGSYADNIHPQAQDFILNERAKIKASQINSKK